MRKTFWEKFKGLFIVDEETIDDAFSLSPSRRRQPKEIQKPTDTQPGKQRNPAPQGADQSKAFRPKKGGSGKQRSYGLKKLQPKKRGQSREKPLLQASFPKTEGLTANLEDNLQKIRDTFSLPDNADIIMRKFQLGTEPATWAAILFTDGIADKTIINNFILRPLMQHDHWENLGDTLFQGVHYRLVPGNQVTILKKYNDLIHSVLEGSTILLLDGFPAAMSIETKGWEHRSVQPPLTEPAVKGPQDAFTENIRTNTGLIRSRLRTEMLVTEMFKVGVKSHTDVALLYLKGLTNDKLVDEVRYRIQSLTLPFLLDSGALEQYLEDPPRSILPTLLSTERPDRTCSLLSEGHVAILVGGSNRAVIAPATFWNFIHTSDELFIRWPAGSFIRLIRVIGIFALLLLPAIYIAMANFHPEMLSTELMLSIAAARERVPFPGLLEVLLMEFSLELIREAGLRIPTAIGPTIGIVGALILGQAAVEAGLVSPILVIVVSITGLGAFAVPNYELGLGLRLSRFFFITMGALFGFFGITLSFVMYIAALVNMKSFGVPFLSPVSPFRHSNPDVVLRGHIFRQERYPSYLRPQDQRRQQPIARAWDPTVQSGSSSQSGQRQGGDNP